MKLTDGQETILLNWTKGKEKIISKNNPNKINLCKNLCKLGILTLVQENPKFNSYKRK